MKYFHPILICLLTYSTLFAQKKDTIQLKIGDKEIFQIITCNDKDDKKDFSTKDTIVLDYEAIAQDLEIRLQNLEEDIAAVESKVYKQNKQSKSAAIDDFKKVKSDFNSIENEYDQYLDELDESFEDWIEELDDRIDDLDDETSYVREFAQLKNVKTRWLLLDYGRSAYRAENAPRIDGVDPTRLNLWKSHSFTLHIFQQRFNLINHHLNFKYGLAWQTNGYAFEDDVRLLHEPQQINFSIGNANFDKNRLRANYAHIPVMLNFESNPTSKRKSFRINAGAYFNFLLNSNYKVKEDGNKVKLKENYHLRQFQPGVLLEVGYGKVNFYGNMALDQLFEDAPENNNYELYPITLGIKLLPF